MANYDIRKTFIYIYSYILWILETCIARIWLDLNFLHYSKYLYPLWFHFLLFTLKEYYITVICCPPWSFTAIFPRQLGMELGSLNKVLVSFSYSLALCTNLSSRFGSLIWCMDVVVDLLVLICSKRKCNIVLINFFHSMRNSLQHQFHWVGKGDKHATTLTWWYECFRSNIGICLHISIPLCTKRCGQVVILHRYSYCQMVEYWCLAALVHVCVTKQCKIIFVAVESHESYGKEC